jgi:hypothetical protein
VVLLAPIRVSAAVPNPVLRADSCLNSYVVLVMLEERDVDLIWDIGQVPAKNFDWLPFTPPPLVAFSGPSISVAIMYKKVNLGI